MRSVCTHNEKSRRLGRLLATSATTGFCFSTQPIGEDTQRINLTFSNVELDVEPREEVEMSEQEALLGSLNNFGHIICTGTIKASDGADIHGAIANTLLPTFAEGWHKTAKGDLKARKFVRQSEADVNLTVLRNALEHDFGLENMTKFVLLSNDMPLELQKVTGRGRFSLTTLIENLRRAGLSEEDVAYKGARLVRALAEQGEGPGNSVSDLIAHIQQVAGSIPPPNYEDFVGDAEKDDARLLIYTKVDKETLQRLSENFRSACGLDILTSRAFERMAVTSIDIPVSDGFCCGMKTGLSACKHGIIAVFCLGFSTYMLVDILKNQR